MKRKMMRFDRELSEMLEQIITTSGYPFAKKKMFGHEVFFLNGYMFSGANELGVFVHLGREAKEKALESETDVAPFSPMEGMVMKDYLLLLENIHQDPQQLKGWLDQSAAYLQNLPPKQKKPGKKRIAKK